MKNNSLVRYVIVGGSAYMLEMAVLYLLRNQLGLSSVVSVGISFWVGFVVAFTLQKMITFKNYDRKLQTVGKQLAGYVLLVGWNYLFTLMVTTILAKHLSVFVIRSTVIAITTFWNYLFYKRLFAEAI